MFYGHGLRTKIIFDSHREGLALVQKSSEWTIEGACMLIIFAMKNQ